MSGNAELYDPGWNLEKERIDAENYLLHRGGDFSAVYMTAANLLFIAERRPESFTPRTIDALETILLGSAHAAQRQAYFLYRKATEVLSTLISRTPDGSCAGLARHSLFTVLHRRTGPAFRAACEAMGALPLSLGTPKTDCMDQAAVTDIDWPDLLSLAGARPDTTPTARGRNRIIPLENGRLLVIKTDPSEEAIPQLHAEITWMRRLSGRICHRPASGAASEIPRPLADSVFRLRRIPQRIAPAGDSSCFAAVFIAPRDYFTYPNEGMDHPLIAPSELKAILSGNARLLGELTGLGFVHTAPIPLFHNRVQRHRRPDNGLYEWQRGGRLDRWLESCRYPNIGASGIRDFEHFMVFDEHPRRLYAFIGTHILSLVLIAGSYFRNRAPEAVGRLADGTPVDARHLFDQPLLREMIGEIFSNYYEGFTGMTAEAAPPVDIDVLTSRLVDEMGVDRHMEEILRVADQVEMDRQSFESFLMERELSPERIAGLEKGVADIAIETGPHLGDFNDRISVPELIEFTAATSAMCIAGRFFRERFGEADHNSYGVKLS